MRSFAILIFAMVALFQSHLAAPSTLAAREDQNVGDVNSKMLSIQQKMLGFGFPLTTLSNYCTGLGLPWGQSCGSYYVLGCYQSNYQTTCWPNSCNGYPGGYYAAWNAMTGYGSSLITLRNQALKSQVDHKEDENQAWNQEDKGFMDCSRSFKNIRLHRLHSPPKKSFLDFPFCLSLCCWWWVCIWLSVLFMSPDSSHYMVLDLMYLTVSLFWWNLSFGIGKLCMFCWYISQASIPCSGNAPGPW